MQGVALTGLALTAERVGFLTDSGKAGVTTVISISDLNWSA